MHASEAITATDRAPPTSDPSADAPSRA